MIRSDLEAIRCELALEAAIRAAREASIAAMDHGADFETTQREAVAAWVAAFDAVADLAL